MGGDADAYLATQGDIWDTQWDMFLALLGSIAAQLLLGVGTIGNWHPDPLNSAANVAEIRSTTTTPGCDRPLSLHTARDRAPQQIAETRIGRRQHRHTERDRAWC